MLTRLMDDLRSAPERLNTRRTELVTKLRQSAHTARGNTETRMYDARVGTLSKVESVLDRLDELPVLKLVAAPAHNLAATRLELATKPALDGYDELNARSVRDALSGLSRIELIKVVRYETANKARKTVLQAAEKAIGKLDVLPEPELQTAAA